MWRFSIVALTIFFGILPSIANADWAYTKWDMTVAEVIGASEGKATENPSVEADSSADRIGRLVAPYQSGNLEFRALFSFDRKAERLISVNLKLLKAEDLPLLNSALTSKYGRPLEQSELSLGTVKRWIDHDNNNVIMLYTIGDDTVAVEYSAAENANNSGL
jgi:hypothetical protein